jgi:small ubiquitin-related modifier
MASKNRDKRITLSVKDKDGIVLFSIKRKTRLCKLMEEFAKRRGTELKEIQFQFDGRKISENQTPREAGIQEGDVIDVLPARAKPRDSKKRAALGGIFAPGGNGGEEEVDWFGGRRALAPVLPVDALTGYHGILVHQRDMAAARAANGRVAAHSLTQRLLRSVRYHYPKSISRSRGLLEEMAEGLGYDFASSVAAAAAAAAAATMRPEAGDASSREHDDTLTPHGACSVVEIIDDAVATPAAERRSAQDYELRMLCTMFTALSHPGGGGDDTMRQGMLGDLMHMSKDLIQDLKAAKGARELKDKDTKDKSAPGAKDSSPACDTVFEGFPDRTLDEWQRLLGRVATQGALEHRCEAARSLVDLALTRGGVVHLQKCSGMLEGLCDDALRANMQALLAASVVEQLHGVEDIGTTALASSSSPADTSIPPGLEAVCRQYFAATESTALVGLTRIIIRLLRLFTRGASSDVFSLPKKSGSAAWLRGVGRLAWSDVLPVLIEAAEAEANRVTKASDAQVAPAAAAAAPQAGGFGAAAAAFGAGFGAPARPAGFGAVPAAPGAVDDKAKRQVACVITLKVKGQGEAEALEPPNICKYIIIYCTCRM